MSFLDLATIAMHRRGEMEARINVLLNKCDHAIEDIKKLKLQTQGFVQQLNCEPSQLKDRFLNCMKQLDEYIYLMTDFNLAVDQLEQTRSIEFTPVHDISTILKPEVPSVQPCNLIDALSEPAPSTSTVCSNLCPPEKPEHTKVPKEHQTLIVFSSTSTSSESVPEPKRSMVEKEVQCEPVEEVNKQSNKDPTSPSVETTATLPAQTMLQTEQSYSAMIMAVDGLSFWVITDDTDEVQSFIVNMTEYYKENKVPLNLKTIENVTYCTYNDSDDNYYRGLFIRLTEEDKNVAELFLVDTGEIRTAPVSDLQSLVPQFCTKPPFARCCHLAGVDLQHCQDKELMQKQEEFMQKYVGTPCTIEVDDNSSESLGVFVTLPSKKTLNELIAEQGLAQPIDKPTPKVPATLMTSTPMTSLTPTMGPPEMTDSQLDITQCPEYEDPVEAVTGYHNRDEADICKHYKGGSEKTCFKGSRCKKKHILKHPDGWTLDRVEVPVTCKTVPLPAPGTWHKVCVTDVGHFDRISVQFVKEKDKKAIEKKHSFGVVLPPGTFDELVRDMNSPASRMAYKPLTIMPAPGELVAALYPQDNQWYRARVLSCTKADQNVEVQYVDFGTVGWVKENCIRQLDNQYLTLPLQAVRCRVAGVMSKSNNSADWAAAKRWLCDTVHGRTVDMRIIARHYDELTVELYDQEGYNVAEQMAALHLVKLQEYAVEDDTKVTQKLVVP